MIFYILLFNKACLQSSIGVGKGGGGRGAAAPPALHSRLYTQYSKMHFFNLMLTKELPMKYYDPRMTKPCHTVTYT